MMVQPFKYPQTNCSVSILSSVFWSGGYSVLKLQLGRVSLDQALFDQKVCSDSILTSSLLAVQQLSNFPRQLFFGDKTNVSANYSPAFQDGAENNTELFLHLVEKQNCPADAAPWLCL